MIIIIIIITINLKYEVNSKIQNNYHYLIIIIALILNNFYRHLILINVLRKIYF